MSLLMVRLRCAAALLGALTAFVVGAFAGQAAPGAEPAVDEPIWTWKTLPEAHPHNETRKRCRDCKLQINTTLMMTLISLTIRRQSSASAQNLCQLRSVSIYVFLLVL